MFKKILVPVDLAETELTQTGLGVALELARADDADVRIVTVLIPTPPFFLNYAPEGFEEELGRNAEDQLADMTSAAPYSRVSRAVRMGSIYREVLAEAESWGADLIVLGSHRPRMATYLIGSNAATIVRHAKWSVLVVRS